MHWMLYLLVVAVVAGIVIAAVALPRARNGYQDEAGFHYGEKPLSPAVVAVAVKPAVETGVRRTEGAVRTVETGRRGRKATPLGAPVAG